MSTELEHEYIFNWNRLKKVSKLSQKPFDLFDETLRDGIQSPSVTDPTIEQKYEILHLMESLGVAEADLGLPGAGKRAYDDVTALVQEIERSKLKIKAEMANLIDNNEVRRRALEKRVPVEIRAAPKDRTAIPGHTWQADAWERRVTRRY